MIKKTLLCIALCAASAASLACTTILVGPGATADGSLIVARNAESNAMKAQHLKMHPAAKNQTGVHSSKAHGGVNDFTYPLPENGLSYSTAPHWKTQIHGPPASTRRVSASPGPNPSTQRPMRSGTIPTSRRPESPRTTFRT